MGMGRNKRPIYVTLIQHGFSFSISQLSPHFYFTYRSIIYRRENINGMTNSLHFKSSYAQVNDLDMYYEVYGEGKPLVLIHGGGSTIQTTFGRIIPLLAKHRQIIAADMQAHGRTSDRNAPLSFEQDADDIAALLSQLHITKADILGFSNGAQTAIEIALRHPGIVGKLILCSTFYKRSGAFTGFWDGFENAQFSQMPSVYADAFLQVNNNEAALHNMFKRDVERMRSFKGWSDEQVRSIQAPTLIMNGNNDVGTLEHAIEMCRTIPGAELVILPGTHGTYLGEINTLEDGKWKQEYAVRLIESFLDKE